MNKVDICDLARMVKDISKPRTTRDEVIAYYKKRYPGEKQIKSKKSKSGYDIRYEWKDKLTNKILELNPSAKRASVSRRFQRDTKTGKDRYEATSPSKAQQAEYKAIGETLPYIPPSGLKIEGSLCMRYLDDPCTSRDFEIEMKGKDLKFFLETYSLQSIVNVYMEYDADYGLAGREDEEMTMFACECPGNPDNGCEWDITIEAGSGSAAEKKPSKGYSTKPKRDTLFKEKAPKKARQNSKGEGPGPLTPDQVTEMFQS